MSSLRPIALAPFALATALLIACTPAVPAEWTALVPEIGLSELSTDDGSPFSAGGLSMTYDREDAPVDQLHDAFRERLAAQEGYTMVMDCARGNSFSVAAVQAPSSVVLASGNGLLPDRVFVNLSRSDEVEFITMPEGCSWLPEAERLCTLRQGQCLL